MISAGKKQVETQRVKNVIETANKTVSAAKVGFTKTTKPKR